MRCPGGNVRQWSYMTDRPREMFPIAYSTAYLALAALITLRENHDDEYDTEAVEYAHRALTLIKAQPETVLLLDPTELEEMGPHLIDNATAWLDE